MCLPGVWKPSMRDLEPSIHRQRFVIEGHVSSAIDHEAIEEYLAGLSDILEMSTLLSPVTHRSDRYGWAGWIHWETSGAHFYAWDKPRPFFSVDIYTCKEFDPIAAAVFTADYFDTTELEFEEFPVSSKHPYLRHPNIEALTELFLQVQDRPDRLDRPFGSYLIDGSSAFADLGRFTELEVFSEFFGNDAALMSDEYDSFDSSSTHIVVIDHRTGMPAGSSRLISHSEHGFKSLSDLARHPEWNVSVQQIEAFHGIELNPLNTLDQATLAVRKEYRSGVVSPALFHGLYWFCLQHDIQNVVGIGDMNFIELCWAMNTPCEVICDLPALSYLDSPSSRPLTINVEKMRALVRDPKESPMAEILRGRGVSGMVSLPPLLLTEDRLGDEVQLATIESPTRSP